MLFGRMGCRALVGLGVATGICVGSAGGFGIAGSQAASWPAQTGTASSMIMLVQAAPQAAPCGPAPAAPCKEPDAKPKPKAKEEKKRRLTPCGPGLAPCADTRQ
jgi:hypothetical protein